jgi:hypothetical protein
MQGDRDNTERLRELAARIAAEQDHDKISGARQGIQRTPRRQTSLSRVAERTVTEEHEDPNVDLPLDPT